MSWIDKIRELYHVNDQTKDRTVIAISLGLGAMITAAVFSNSIRAPIPTEPEISEQESPQEIYAQPVICIPNGELPEEVIDRVAARYFDRTPEEQKKSTRLRHLTAIANPEYEDGSQAYLFLPGRQGISIGVLEKAATLDTRVDSLRTFFSPADTISDCYDAVVQMLRGGPNTDFSYRK